MAADLASRRFRAMGADARLVIVGGPEGLADHLVDVIDGLERRWSRFLPDSEISALNGNAGKVCAVDPSTVALVRHAIEAWRLTGGRFDPTVLGDVVRAGYTGSLAGQRDGTAGDRPPGDSDLIIGCPDIVIDADRSTVTLPPGTGFDPGGIGKGYAADLVTAAAHDAGAEGVCVNAGGDLRVRGAAPNGGSWHVAVEHPDRPRPIAHLDLAAGAVATSTTRRRRWTSAGAPRHHVIDPATGAPAATDVELMTVIAGTGWQAEVLATASLLRGADRALDLLDEHAHGLLLTTDGRVVHSAGIAPFLRSDEAVVA
jgi:thiamine biosynthesis lipoprotein